MNDNNEQIKTSTSNEVPEFKKNSLFDPNLEFDSTLGFIPLNEFK
jgi:hypothetical protein